MDDNTMKLVEKLISLQAELTELRTLRASLVNILWGAELKEAKDYKRYGGKYKESLDETRVFVSEIRDIFGIMPNPEAVAIFKEVEATKEDEDEESGE